MRKENIENKKIIHLLEIFFGNKNNEVRDYSLINLNYYWRAYLHSTVWSNMEKTKQTAWLLNKKSKQSSSQFLHHTLWCPN